MIAVRDHLDGLGAALPVVITFADAPSRLAAVLCAVLFVVLLLKIGDDANYDFIYFQF